MRIIACGSPYGKGGVGQHFAQLVETSRAEGVLAHYFTLSIKPGDAEKGRVVPLFPFQWIRRYTPVRFSQGWTSHLGNEIFDRRVASQLDAPCSHFMGFVGQARHSFRHAAALGCERLELVATNSHVNQVRRQHAQARRQSGIRDSWLNEAQRRKTLEEYRRADVVYVHSEYTRQSFIEEGVREEKLRRMYLHVDARFEPPTQRPDDDVFRIAYVGRVEATKGIPLLLEAFARLPVPRAELTLVGGWSTRAMRRYMEQKMAEDPRIRVAPGDPLPVLQRADVFVHPTYEDGFGYAPVEALACGVPVIVTEDTGMKEYVREGVNGYVVPTGSWPAILERLEHIAAHPMTRTAPAPDLVGSFVPRRAVFDAE